MPNPTKPKFAATAVVGMLLLAAGSLAAFLVSESVTGASPTATVEQQPAEPQQVCEKP